MKLGRIIAIDKSILAANMYRLLFAPLYIRVDHVISIQDLKKKLIPEMGLDLMIINTNTLSGDLTRATDVMEDNAFLAKIPKIFLCRESEIEKGWKEDLAVFSNMEVVTKPFHPDEFTSRVKKILAI